MKPPKRCECGRPKSDHYTVTIRRKRRKLAGCTQYREAQANPGQLALAMPRADNPQPPSNQKNS